MRSAKRQRCYRCEQGAECEVPHGTFSGYNYHRCRCFECREFVGNRKLEWVDANRQQFNEDQAKYRARRRAAGLLAEPGERDE